MLLILLLALQLQQLPVEVSTGFALTIHKHMTVVDAADEASLNKGIIKEALRTSSAVTN